MKRSAQLGLVLMGALGTTTAAGLYLNNRDQACQAGAPNNPQGAPAQNCRRSIWSGSGHGSGGSHPIFGGGSSSGGSAATSTPSSAGTSVQRGGFGGFASRVGGFFSGG
jgi:hypothetical protein